MRSLFLKIFLWIWLAMILAGVVQIAAALWLDSGPALEQWRALTATTFNLYGQVVDDIAAKKGLPAALEYIDRLEQTTDLKTYLYDAEGKEVRGRTAPSRAAALLKEARQTGRPQIRIARTVAAAARPLSAAAAAGNVFLVVAPGVELKSIRVTPVYRLVRFGAMLAMTGILCYWLTRYIANPVIKMRSATRRLASGDLGARVGETVGRRKDEIAELARDFDFMAERIESLLSTQRVLLRDISHELRSPLARLSVALELARQRVGPEAGGTLDRIERETGRLNELIGHLLMLARLESGTVDLQTFSVDLAQLVRDVAADAEFEASDRRRKVRILQSEECTLTGLPHLLRSAIENVVRNAVRYTADGTDVELKLAREEQDGKPYAVIRVRDHGPGVPEESLAEIFRPFHRVCSARDRQTGGTGLGLAITYRAIQAHGGTVQAANAPDGGLIVEIRLPIRTTSQFKTVALGADDLSAP